MKHELHIGQDTNNLAEFVSLCCHAPLSLEPLCRVVCGVCGSTQPVDKVVHTSKLTIEVAPIGRWGRYPTFPGKVGTHASCCLIIKRTRKFYVGQRIEFAIEHELRGVSKSFGIHKWHVGYIWKIEDRIFVNYV